MATRTTTFICGHVTTRQAFGKDETNALPMPCPACRTGQSQQVAAELLANLLLPELAGSEKQIAWASNIRAEMLARADEYIAIRWARAFDTRDPQAKQAAIIAEVTAAFQTKQAAWWIDNRDRVVPFTV